MGNKAVMNVKAVYIKLPFWLRWAKRFIRLELKTYPIIPKQIEGRSIDFIIVDEAKWLK